MHRFCWLLALLGFLSLAASPAAAAAAAKRPNIIVILVDDFGYECLSADGSTTFKTPHIDKLAGGGMRFEYCFAQPLCTPTRAQIMTGQYNVRNYVHFGTLETNQKTFAHLLKSAGYVTGIAGKWQLGKDMKLPGHFGFDEYCLWQLTRRPSRYASPGLEINGKEIDYPEKYGPDVVNDYALDFISREKDQPFFLYYPMMLTHGPYVPTPDSNDWDSKAAENKAGKDEKHFADMVHYTDKLVGKLVARLDELKLRENTLILLTGDNGTGRGTVSYMGDKKVVGGKGMTNDSGMRVPLVASWPGTIAAGKVSKDLVDMTDFLPTVCAAAGVAVPSDLTIDGQSFLPQLKGETGKPREWTYCWYNPDGGKKAKGEFARNHDFKLTRDGKFYDVAAGDYDDRPLDDGKLTAAGKAAKQKLQAVLDRYEKARPAHIAAQGQKGPGSKE